jgi:hypothetical protein
VRADEFGNWNLPYSSADLPADGTYTVKVTATDAAGNVSSITSQAGVLIDAGVPSSPVINSITGENIVDATENAAGFTITGTGEYANGQGATITVSFSDGATLSGSNTATVQSDSSWSIAVGALEAGNKFNDGSELITVTQTDAAGNTSVAKTQLFSVSTTLYTSGDLSSTDLSSYSTVYLNGAATLPNDNAKLPNAINVQSNAVTVAADLDLSAVNITNLGNLTVSGSATLTLAVGQANSYNASGGTIDVSAGTISVTTGGDLSSLDLSNVSLVLNANSTLPNTTNNLPKALDAATRTTTIGASVDLSNVTLTQPGDFVVSSGTLTVSVAQANAIASAMSTELTATLAAGSLSSLGSLSTGAADVITVTVNDANDAAVNATDLSTLGGKTAGVVTVSNAVAISGTTAEVTAALVTTDTLVVAGTAKITLSDSPSLSEYNAIDGKTSGALTYTSISDSLSNLLTDAGDASSAIGYNKTLTVTDTGTLQASDVSTLSANTSQTVTASSATTISGSAANFVTLINDTGVTLGASYNATVSGTASTAQLATIDGDTSGTVSVADITDTISSIQTFQGGSASQATILENATGTITANGSGVDSADLSAVQHGITINLGAEADTVVGTGFADTITGGTNTDIVYGGSGIDTYVFNTGDAPTALVATLKYDKIGDFNASQDKIDLQVSPVLGSAESTSATLGGQAGTVAIDSSGLVQFSGSGVGDASLSEVLNAVRAVVQGAGEIGLFQFDDGLNTVGTYVYQENSSSSSDLFIFLDGVTGIADTSTSLGDANTLHIY